MEISNIQGQNTSTFDSISIRDSIKLKKIEIDYLPTDQMLADILTKGLPGPKVKAITEKLGIY